MILFAILQFINVVLGSLRSITTAKSGRHIAALFNVISYTWYAAIVYFTASQELWFVLIITVITNIIGYYLADFIFSRAQRDRVWQIITEPLYRGEAESFEQKLKEENISFTIQKTIHDGHIFTLYSYSQEDSIVIKNILKSVDKNIKYFITEMTRQL